LAKRIGLYICSGCEIGKSVDVPKLCESIPQDDKLILCHTHSSLCSIEGLSLIKKGINENELDSVIIAACSPRIKTEAFDFPENILIERVNIREQVAWTQEAMTEDSQMAAEDYIRMGVEKIKSISLPHPFIAENISSDILVVGGGITGITAAIEGAKAGYTIHLVEKEKSLGGYAAKLHRQIPYKPPYTSPEKPILFDKIEEIKNFKNIEIHLSTEIEKISGQPGDFSVILKNGDASSIKVGSIVSAMGWKPYDANKLSHLGYGKFKNVLSSVEYSFYSVCRIKR
jgi:quinone-modifying oxidoreductase, subunit QmoB